MENEKCIVISPEREDFCIQLATSIEETLRYLPQISPNCCIFRVPVRLREMNEDAYTPRMVSIGPFHYGREDLAKMEDYKLSYLKAFLDRTTVNLEHCLRLIKGWEERCRACYAERITLRSDEFVRMILVDSSFVIESILKFYLGKHEQGSYGNLLKDMILLENQLPFFVLEGLFNLALVSRPREKLEIPSFLQLAVNYIKGFLLIDDVPKWIAGCKVNHFVDLLRAIHLPPFAADKVRANVVEFVRARNASALHEAGLKFKVSKSESIFDIQYSNGVLAISRFNSRGSTERMLRNIIALEQYLYPCNSYILDWVYFMDGLIDTPKDVEVLVQNGIIENWDDNLGITDMFNNLTSETFLVGQKFYFYHLSKDLDLYCETPWHKWKATLKRDYFSTPMRTASTIAAIILLVLTFIQTICALIAVGV